MSSAKIGDISRLAYGKGLWEYIPMPTSVAREVRRLLSAYKISAHKASRLAGLGPTYVRDMLRGRSRDPRSADLEKLATVFHRTADDLRHPKEGLDNLASRAVETTTRADLLGRAYALADRLLRGKALLDRAATTHRVAAVIYDVLAAAARDGSPVSEDDAKAALLIEALVRRTLDEFME